MNKDNFYDKYKTVIDMHDIMNMTIDEYRELKWFHESLCGDTGEFPSIKTMYDIYRKK